MEKGMAGERIDREQVEPVEEIHAAADAAALQPPDETPGPVGPVGRPAVAGAPTLATARASDAPPTGPTESAPQAPSGTATQVPAAPDARPMVTFELPATSYPAPSITTTGPPDAGPAAGSGAVQVPPPPAAVPEATPTGVRKYVYVKGVGNVPWESLSDDEKREYVARERARRPRHPPVTPTPETPPEALNESTGLPLDEKVL